LNDDVAVLPLSQAKKIPGIPMVSRANVARAMLDAIQNDQVVGQRILVTSGSGVGVVNTDGLLRY
jgi:hypothetical protein